MSIPIPKEHGSWVMFFTAFIIGIFIAGSFTLPVMVYLLSTLALFMIRYPIFLLTRMKNKHQFGVYTKGTVRLWIIIYGFTGTASGLVLVMILGRPLLVYLGVFALILLSAEAYRGTQTARQTLLNELAGAAGLSLIGLGAYYVSTNRLDARAWQMTFLLALYFVMAVFYVRMKAHWVTKPPTDFKTRWETGSVNILFSLAALILTLGLASYGLLPNLSWLAILPAILRNVFDALRGQRETNFKRRGWIETIYIVIFLVLVVLAFKQ